MVKRGDAPKGHSKDSRRRHGKEHLHRGVERGELGNSLPRVVTGGFLRDTGRSTVGGEGPRKRKICRMTPFL